MFKKEFFAVPNFNKESKGSVFGFSGFSSVTDFDFNYVTKDEYDKCTDKFFFFVDCYKNKPRLFKKETQSMEAITKIALFHNSEDEEIISGPSLKAINDLDKLYEVLKGENIKIWTEKSGPCFIKSSKQILNPSGYQSIPVKLTIEETPKTLKVREYSQMFDCMPFGGPISKSEYFETISFDFDKKKYRYYPKERISRYSKPICSFVNSYYENTLLDKLPENILKEISDALVLYYNKNAGIEYKNEDISPEGIRSFAICPENKYYFQYQDLFSVALPKEKKEFEKAIADILELDNNEFFKEKLYENINCIFALSALKKAGFKEIEKFYDFFKELKLRITMENNPIVYNRIKDAFKIMLKYRTEEEIISAVTASNEFNFEVLNYIIKAEEENLFNAQMFDRFAYNKFNGHAINLLYIYEQNYLKNLKENLIKNAVKDYSTADLKVYVVNDEDIVKSFQEDFVKKFAKANLYPQYLRTEAKEIIVIEDNKNNFSFRALDEHNHTETYNLYHNFLDREYTNFTNIVNMNRDISRIITDELSSISIEPEAELPFF